MTKKNYANDHEEALHRLCFVCGELLVTGSRFYVVEKHLELLSGGLKCPSVEIIPCVTPHNFCRNCFAAVSRVKSGKSVKSARTENVIGWVKCGLNCTTCERLIQEKIPRKKNVKKKVSLLYAQ